MLTDKEIQAAKPKSRPYGGEGEVGRAASGCRIRLLSVRRVI
jgi:hypothetical protein